MGREMSCCCAGVRVTAPRSGQLGILVSCSPETARRCASLDLLLYLGNINSMAQHWISLDSHID